MVTLSSKNGNIALGYSRANTTTFASLFIATRAPTDTLRALQTETLFYTGTGSQTGSNRWGDYSAMSVDPTDDCMFWYTTEYYPTSAGNTWHTRLGSFKMPNCSASSTIYGLSLAPISASQSGNPGQVVTYTLAVTNTGNASDTFTVTLSGNAFSTIAPATLNVKSQGNPAQQASVGLTTTAIWRKLFLPFIWR